MNVTEGNRDSSNNQQSKAEPKWQAITSLVFGLISILPGIYIIHFDVVYRKGWPWVVLLWLCLSSWLFGATAFVLGIMGLKHKTRPVAIAGIILSLIGLVIYTALYNSAVQRNLE